MTRRQWLVLAAGQAAFAQDVTTGVRTDAPDRRPEIGEIVREYGSQGSHRTGTAVDETSGEWLMERVRYLGVTPAREDFELSRVNVVNAGLTIAGRRIDGLPLFDGAFTDSSGVRGRLGPLNSGAPIGIAEIAPNTAGAGALGEARRANRHRAIVAVTRGARPGFCPSNADDFLRPFGPPVVQVSSERRESLDGDVDALLVAEVNRSPAMAFNVTARVPGSDSALPPLVIMTPRSGWWSCASERGGGIVCWLEAIRAMVDAKPARDVLFVASSGHEVGYLGIREFVARRPGIVGKAQAWIHFGANVGAAQDPGNTVQASDDDMESLERRAMLDAGLGIDRRVPRGTIPGGEAGVVHRGGGRYMSIIGRSALFHNPADRGASAIDVNAIDRFAAAFSAIAVSLAKTA